MGKSVCVQWKLSLDTLVLDRIRSSAFDRDCQLVRGGLQCLLEACSSEVVEKGSMMLRARGERGGYRYQIGAELQNVSGTEGLSGLVISI